MAGSLNEDNGSLRSSEGLSSGERCQSTDSLAEWRSSEQVENGAPSTSPPYWDSDDDDDCGPKPSDLYGKFTWKIENFSQISKRELRSNAFEVGGYKWYILIYPQGCDVCNHLSLFLCVANHDKLLPGWSHFAQFTIAVVNKDPKKSKYSDTLHRFWKKEHDWGWKKFMELSKVLDGFIVSDTLVIKAQVQVIRERTDRPFRCLDCQYRRELVRVYLSNVELICRRFVDDQRTKLSQLIDDKVRWLSFRSFWLEMDQNCRLKLSSDKADSILKMVVKTFFVEKEVTSTLVMDSLYSGLKSLDPQAFCKTKKVEGIMAIESEEVPSLIMCVENDMFALADDVLVLLEKAAIDPLPAKDDTGPQNRMKDGNTGDDYTKDSIERDEKRLTELGRRTIEIFVLAHIFSTRIEVAFREAIALKRQEELIREEEAAGQAECDNRAKRWPPLKEKRSKKKSKSKRNDRKGKERGKLEKFDESQNKNKQRSSSAKGILDISPAVGKIDLLEIVSDASDAADDASGAKHFREDQDPDLASCDSDASETILMENICTTNLHTQCRPRSIVDDSSSTCSTDSVPSSMVGGHWKGDNLPSCRSQMSSTREKNQDNGSLHNRFQRNLGLQVTESAVREKVEEFDSEQVVHTLEDRMQHLVLKSANKEDIMPSNQMPSNRGACLLESKLNDSPKLTCHEVLSSCFLEKVSNPARQQPIDSFGCGLHPVPTPTDSARLIVKDTSSKEIFLEKPLPERAAILSRPSSAPLIPVLASDARNVSTVNVVPVLARSASAASRINLEPSSSMPLSRGNGMAGTTVCSSSAVYAPCSNAGTLNPLSYAQPTLSLPSPRLPLERRMDPMSRRSAFTFGTVTSEILPSSLEVACQQTSCSFDPQVSENVSRSDISDQACRSVFHSSDVQSRQSQDEFPHLDIINYLLDEEHSISRVSKGSGTLESTSGHYHYLLNQQLDFSTEVETQRAYAHSHQYDMRDNIHVCLAGYANVQFEEVLQSHWPVAGPSFPVLGARTGDSEGCHPYQIPSLSSVGGTANYPLFRSANGFY